MCTEECKIWQIKGKETNFLDGKTEYLICACQFSQINL